MQTENPWLPGAEAVHVTARQLQLCSQLGLADEQLTMACWLRFALDIFYPKRNEMTT